MKIALVGNPNCGKTTMFNDMTGANQYVGNWPGVTVEKKTGKLLKDKSVQVVDLPGIYSLSPYTLEEVITRDYIREESPDVIINIIDATNLERNLYLTSQVLEMNTPTVIALNMMDMVKSENLSIDVSGLESKLGVPIIETSAVKGKGLNELISKAIEVGYNKTLPNFQKFGVEVENAIKKISELVNLDLVKDRYLLVKLFEKDEKVLKKVNLDENKLELINKIVSEIESKMDDDSESIITTERYDNIQRELNDVVKKSSKRQLTLSDKIDKIVTNRRL